jgi:hypothetical protein
MESGVKAVSYLTKSPHKSPDSLRQAAHQIYIYNSFKLSGDIKLILYFPGD